MHQCAMQKWSVMICFMKKSGSFVRHPCRNKVERFSGTDGKAMKPDELKDVATCLSPSAAQQRRLYSFVDFKDFKPLPGGWLW